MGFKFFVYRYAEEKGAAEIADSIGRLTEVAKCYNHKEEMLLFTVLPPKHLAEVAKLVDRNHVKITQAHPVRPSQAEAAAVIQALKKQGVDAVLWEGCTAEDAPEEIRAAGRQSHQMALEQGLKSMLCLSETKAEKERHTEEDSLEKQAAKAYENIPVEAIYRTVAVYRPYWGAGTPRANQEALHTPIAAIRRGILRAKPGLPVALPVFFSGAASPKQCTEGMQSGLVDGFLVDDSTMSDAAFARVILEVMGGGQ